MYFQQQNFFPSLDQSNQDLKKMMDLSASNDEYILQSGNFGQSNLQSNSNIDHNIKESSFGQPKQAVIIDSQNQNQDENKSQSSSVLRNGYSKYETQIKSLLPQIHSHLIEKHYNQFQQSYQERLEKYKMDIGQGYQKKIQSKIDQIKQNINVNLSTKIQHVKKLKQQLNSVKKSIKDPKKTLSLEQEHNLVQRTVSEIFNSQKLLNEIKQKIKPKIEERVRFILIRDLEKQLTKCQNEIEDKIAQERQQFKQKRKLHWEEQAQNQLRSLAVEFQQLKDKKFMMQEAVKQKISEKQQTMKKYKESVERFKQVQQLEKNIKQLQQKLSKGNNKKRPHSKSIQSKINKRA